MLAKVEGTKVVQGKARDSECVGSARSVVHSSCAAGDGDVGDSGNNTDLRSFNDAWEDTIFPMFGVESLGVEG